MFSPSSACKTLRATEVDPRLKWLGRVPRRFRPVNTHKNCVNTLSFNPIQPGGGGGGGGGGPWIAAKICIKVECDVNYKTVLLDYSLLLSFILYELHIWVRILNDVQLGPDMG